MKDIQMSDSKQKLTVAQISAVEEKFKIKLPNSYREFLLRHNGGTSNKCLFRWKQPDGAIAEGIVNRWLSIYDGDDDNFEGTYAAFKIEDERLPANLVPIAIDPGANLICISIGEKNYDHVYFWDAQDDSGYTRGQPPTLANTQLLASSFDEFLNSLEAEE